MDVGYPYILLHLLSFPLEEDIRETEKKLSTLTVSKLYSDNEIKLDFVGEVAGNSIWSPCSGAERQISCSKLRPLLLVALSSNYKGSFKFFSSHHGH